MNLNYLSRLLNLLFSQWKSTSCSGAAFKQIGQEFEEEEQKSISAPSVKQVSPDYFQVTTSHRIVPFQPCTTKQMSRFTTSSTEHMRHLPKYQKHIFLGFASSFQI